MAELQKAKHNARDRKRAMRDIKAIVRMLGEAIELIDTGCANEELVQDHELKEVARIRTRAANLLGDFIEPFTDVPGDFEMMACEYAERVGPLPLSARDAFQELLDHLCEEV